MEEKKDERLWKKAKARAAFKRDLIGFVLMNIAFWGIWLFTAGAGYFSDRKGIPWPAWITLGWGIAILFNYFKAYKGSKSDMAAEEYEKLKREKAE